jgi:2-oxoglutarate dehydrogenase E2 component (dihydrolipoamide succinyltransferase)
MPTKVILPQLGESVDEATVSKWLVTEGDEVKEFDPLLEVNTDKVDSEIPSPITGTVLEILVSEGETVQAGTVLAYIAEPGEEVSEAKGDGKGKAGEVEVKEAVDEKQSVLQAKEPTKAPQPVSAAKQQVEAPSPGRDKQLGFISPVVSKIANEHNVDLREVTGTGREGRITKKDVLAYLEQREHAFAEFKTAPPAEAPPAWQIPVVPEEKSSSVTKPSPMPAAAPGELIQHSVMRRKIAEHMVHSKRTAPHVTTVMEADMSRVVAHREANKSSYARDGANLTFTAYFVAASVAALKAHPIVNSSWEEEGVRIQPAINIGVAASLGEQGLIVPVIKNADRLSLLGIVRTINDLANRARARQLQPDEVQGGTFTITNHGVSGSLFATPIINQPQCGILGVGAIQKRVVVINDAIAIRPMVYISLTFDHRILDGAIADAFLAMLVESLENWQ